MGPGIASGERPEWPRPALGPRDLYLLYLSHEPSLLGVLPERFAERVCDEDRYLVDKSPQPDTGAVDEAQRVW